jgi:hypothetical protein
MIKWFNVTLIMNFFSHGLISMLFQCMCWIHPCNFGKLKKTYLYCYCVMLSYSLGLCACAISNKGSCVIIKILKLKGYHIKHKIYG